MFGGIGSGGNETFGDIPHSLLKTSKFFRVDPSAFFFGQVSLYHPPKEGAPSTTHKLVFQASPPTSPPLKKKSMPQGFFFAFPLKPTQEGLPPKTNIPKGAWSGR